MHSDCACHIQAAAYLTSGRRNSFAPKLDASSKSRAERDHAVHSACNVLNPTQAQNVWTSTCTPVGVANVAGLGSIMPGCIFALLLHNGFLYINWPAL